MKLKKKHTIILSPLGHSDPEVFNAVSDAIERIYGYPTQIDPLLDTIDFAFDDKRDQYHSTPILDQLEQKAPPQALKIIAITAVDLFIPILTFVYGEAQLGGRTCMISTCRLGEELPETDPRKAFLGRVAKESVHELGHTFNLRHCKDSACIMHYCRNIADVDHKEQTFCRYCQIMVSDEIKRLT